VGLGPAISGASVVDRCVQHRLQYRSGAEHLLVGPLCAGPLPQDVSERVKLGTKWMVLEDQFLVVGLPADSEDVD
jgi:hypothetical protein